MDEFQKLQKRVELLEGIVATFARGDKMYISKETVVKDGVNFVLPTTNGENQGFLIGTSPDQKLGFWGGNEEGRGATQADLFTWVSPTDVSGTGDDATINTNYNRMESAFDTLADILKNCGITASS